MPAIIPLVIAGIAAGTSLASGGGGTPNLTPPKASPLTSTQNAQQTAMVGQQLPNEQALTGGSLSPEYFAQFGQLQSGLGNDPQATGNIQEAINKFFGLTAPGNTGLTASGTTTGGSGGAGILDLLKNVKPPGAGVDSGGEGFINQTLNSDSFKGLVT